MCSAISGRYVAYYDKISISLPFLPRSKLRVRDPSHCDERPWRPRGRRSSVLEPYWTFFCLLELLFQLEFL